MAIIIDLVLIGIIVAVCVNSYIKGLVISVFNLVSSLVAIVLSYLFYPVVAGFLKGTAILGWIQSPIRDSLLEHGATLVNVSAESLLAQLKLSPVISDGILSAIGDVSGQLPELAEAVSAALAGFILEIICIVLLFVIVKIGLLFAKGLLKTVTKLPLLHQVDKLGGLAFGLIEAFVLLTVVGAIFVLFGGNVDSGVLGAVESTFLAKFFYQENLLIALLSNKI